jgi:hypothetical protein
VSTIAAEVDLSAALKKYPLRNTASFIPSYIMTAEFDDALQAVLTSSKGGIPSGTKIKEVASYCVNNVQVLSPLQ